MKNDSVFIQTFYNKPDLQRAVTCLEKNSILFTMDNKSGMGNFKVPGSVYFEVQLFCQSEDEVKARKIIEESI